MKANREQICSDVSAGLTVNEIMQKYGYQSDTFIRRVILENGLQPNRYHKEKKVVTEIERAINKQRGIEIRRQQQLKTFDSITDEIIELSNGKFISVGDYKRNLDEFSLTVRCRDCGTEKTISSSTIRGWKNLGFSEGSCLVCRHRQTEIRKEQTRICKQEQRLVEKYRARLDRQEQVSMRFGTCKECGKPFVIDSRKTYCSEKCANRSSNNRKDKRLTKNNIVDKDITLEKLYERDSGVCYLCGKVCDWNDYEWQDGIKVCGDNYPSRDHIIPLAKGGKHSWDNVKLACRICNYLKSDNILPLVE